MSVGQSNPKATTVGPAWYTFAGVAAIFLVTLVLTWPFVDPAPPGRVTIATGIDGGFYDLLGRRYAQHLQAAGVEVDLRASRGTIDNLAALQGGDADFALVQGGAGRASNGETVRAVASVALEPIWIFTSAIAPLARLEELSGKTLAAGPEGSGTRLMALNLLTAAGLEDRVRLSPLAGEAAEQALVSGSVDAALFVTAASTPPVARLLQAEKAVAARLVRADAFQRTLPYLSVVEIPQGSLDLRNNVPGQDLRVLAAVTGLATREDVHPALTALMLDAAEKIHREERVFGEAGRFPAAGGTDFPLDQEARRYFEHGPSFLRRYLPFWAANMVDRLWVLLIPLATIMVPLVRAAPPVYRWQIRRRIYRWYRTLKDIEFTWWTDHSEATRERLLTEMDDLQAEVGQIEVPLSYADEVYRLRTHIQFVEGLIRDGRRPAAVTAGKDAQTVEAPEPGPVPATGAAVTRTASSTTG